MKSGLIHLRHLSAILSFSCLASCGASPHASSTAEAPDFWNALSRFGINRVFTYPELISKAEIATPNVPWSDTYWPLANKGMAWRYGAAEDSAGRREEVKIATYLKHYAAESGKKNPDPLLSPAEKYDLAYQYRHGVTVSSRDLKDLIAALATQDAAIKAEKDMGGKKSLLTGMAYKLNGSLAEEAMSMTLAGWSSFLNESAASKNKYLAIDSNPGDDWSWEGHCHGWAPAAVMSRPPKHGVMAMLGDKKVFFSEGDIRGLMTKAWADRGPDDQQYFLARRCEESPQDVDASIPANALGRGYSGKLTTSGKVQHFIVLESMPRMKTISPSEPDTTLNFYRIRLDESGEKLYLVENPSRDRYWTVPFLSDLDDAVRTGNFSALTSVDATLTGCWDPNPASFHAVLIEQLAERKTGFVMDRTRTGQVWNQPVYAASFQIGPLVAVTATNDAARAYRAAATAFVSEVSVRVTWSGEPESPALSYAADFDSEQLQESDYNYTLEFDSQQRLIGGEWGTLAKMDASSNAPDFLYGYSKGAVPADSVVGSRGSARIDYSGIIARLHDCSLDEATDGTLKVGSERLSYKTCGIDQAK